MTVAELQSWLNEHGAALVVDGKGGPATRAAIMAAFTNPHALAITAEEVAGFARRLNVSIRQLNAVAKVESAGGGFDAVGRPKILFERHYFHRLTAGKWSVTNYSNPVGGGYGEDSWGKLCQAACLDPGAAFSSISVGKFQVMGAHWATLGYPSPISMVYTCVQSEADHYEMLVRFVEANKLQDKMGRISANAADCVAFAKAYNGPAYEKFKYHAKLASAMA